MDLSVFKIEPVLYLSFPHGNWPDTLTVTPACHAGHTSGTISMEIRDSVEMDLPCSVNEPVICV